MPATPLQVAFIVKDSDSVALSNIQVTCSNETTAQSTAKNTSSDGGVIFNLGSLQDFSSGWNIGDKISVFSLYQGYQQSFSFTIPAVGSTTTIKDDSGSTVGSFVGGIGMTSGTLTLVSVPATPSLRYFTSQEFLDYFDLKTKDDDAEHGVSLLQLAKIGEMVEHDIDSDCQTKFDDNSGDYYSPTIFADGESPEYHDVKHDFQQSYFTKYIPINEVTTFQKNNNAEGSSADWETLTEDDDEIAIDKSTGRIKIIETAELPSVGARHVRITYTFGRSSVPKEIKELSIMETGRRMHKANFISSRITGFDDKDLGDTQSFMEFRNKIIRKFKNHAIIPT